MFFIRKLTSSYRKRGLTGTIRFACGVARDICTRYVCAARDELIAAFSRIARGKRTAVVLDGKEIFYFYHRHNRTFENERAIEIPIVWSFVQKARTEGNSILEFGNVLSHYFGVDHAIVDLYEKARGVMNIDIVDFNLSRTYDLVVSISTLEHVGYDTGEKQDDEKPLRALGKLVSLVSPGGTMVITMPLGYNPNIDSLIKNKPDAFGKLYFLKRISRDNRWEWSCFENVAEAKYGAPFPAANALAIGIFMRKH